MSTEKKKEICDEKGETHHSALSMVSFSFSSFIDEIMDVAFGVVVFFFWEVEVLLNPILIFFAYSIYSIWNAVNDPLMGYLTDRPFKFTRKLGRRFPWILIGAIGWLLMYILIFTPPNVNPTSGAWILFLWLVLTTCVYDAFASIKSTNFLSLFPDKYRGRERRKASGIIQFIGFFGIAIGSILPGLFIDISYVFQAIIMVFIGMIAVILMIPGIKDDKYMVERYLEKCDQEVERESFFKIFKTAIKSKNYMVIVIGYFLMQTTTACLLSSIYYLTNFILMEPDADTLVMIPFLLGALIASPTWTYLANRIDDNRKAMLISSSIEILFLIPLLIAQNMVLAMIGSGLFGFAFGGHAVIYRGILFPDAIDETVVIMGKRREGTFIGVRDFFGRLSFLAQAGIFAFIHIITGFDPTTTNQTDLAKLGISIHLALVPIICTAIVTLLIWKVYDITPQKSKEIRAKIIELKL